MRRHLRKTAVSPPGRRPRRKNYDDDEFDSVDFGPGDPQPQAGEQTPKAK